MSSCYPRVQTESSSTEAINLYNITIEKLLYTTTYILHEPNQNVFLVYSTLDPFLYIRKGDLCTVHEKGLTLSNSS